MDADLPDFGQTPRQMLDSGDVGMLLLLDRLVNAIATSRALSHPLAVRDIVRRRLQIRFREVPAFDPFARHVQNFERWMEVPNPMFEGDTPGSFFRAREVDATRLRKISSLLDTLDDGAFS